MNKSLHNIPRGDGMRVPPNRAAILRALADGVLVEARGKNGDWFTLAGVNIDAVNAAAALVEGRATCWEYREAPKTVRVGALDVAVPYIHQQGAATMPPLWYATASGTIYTISSDSGNVVRSGRAFTSPEAARNMWIAQTMLNTGMSSEEAYALVK